MVVAVEVACPHRIAVDCRRLPSIAVDKLSLTQESHCSWRISCYFASPRYSAHPVCYRLSILSLQRANPPCPEKSTRGAGSYGTKPAIRDQTRSARIQEHGVRVFTWSGGAIIGPPSPSDQDQLAFLGQLAKEMTRLVLGDPAQGRDVFSRFSPGSSPIEGPFAPAESGRTRLAAHNPQVVRAPCRPWG